MKMRRRLMSGMAVVGVLAATLSGLAQQQQGIPPKPPIDPAGASPGVPSPANMPPEAHFR